METLHLLPGLKGGVRGKNKWIITNHLFYGVLILALGHGDLLDPSRNKISIIKW